jgi:hypothetical protein
MSARVESAPVGRFNVGTMAIAVAIALGIGGVAGLMVTRATEERPATITRPVGIASWDVQKLEAMEGRQLAAQVHAAQPAWDAGMLRAMEGRQLAEEVRSQPGTADRWDEGKARGHGRSPVGGGDPSPEATGGPTRVEAPRRPGSVLGSPAFGARRRVATSGISPDPTRTNPPERLHGRFTSRRQALW